jgi:hypothetical protein
MEVLLETTETYLEDGVSSERPFAKIASHSEWAARWLLLPRVVNEKKTM